tara:strand:+ start:8008 stop:8853 length:846 start_codon:yes stop_codon:yes gene_type:complete
MNTNIGIVGQGFVGTAVKEGLSKHFNIQTYDRDLGKSTCNTLDDLVLKTDVIFVCLPTPMLKNGECDTTIVKNTVKQINATGYNKIVIIKSTVPPGTTEKLNKECDCISVVFSPEFLTEANFIDDFKNQSRIIVGGVRPASTKVKNIFRKAFPKTPIIKTSSTVAECIKYFTNTFLATKVSFANEFKQMCNSIDVDYDKVLEYALYDERIGSTHLSVPGPDGNLGFGGSCFPKDVNALISYCKMMGLNPTVLESVWEKNLEVRPSKDWEELEGRAVNYNKE